MAAETDAAPSIFLLEAYGEVSVFGAIFGDGEAKGDATFGGDEGRLASGGYRGQKSCCSMNWLAWLLVQRGVWW